MKCKKQPKTLQERFLSTSNVYSLLRSRVVKETGRVVAEITPQARAPSKEGGPEPSGGHAVGSKPAEAWGPACRTRGV